MEVENEKVVSRLAKKLGYQKFEITNSPDERGVDVALLYMTPNKSSKDIDSPIKLKKDFEINTNVGYNQNLMFKNQLDNSNNKGNTSNNVLVNNIDNSSSRNNTYPV